jgi:hypothetical protein
VKPILARTRKTNGPGRLWISLDAGLLFALDGAEAKKQSQREAKTATFSASC